MNKKAGFIIFLMIISLVVLAYLLLTSKKIEIKPKPALDSEAYSRQLAENRERMESEYKIQLKNVLTKFKTAYSSETEKAEIDRKAIEGRNKLAGGMTVPAQFRDLHMNLFLAFSKMEGATGDQVNVIADEIYALIAEAEKSYDWLR